MAGLVVSLWIRSGAIELDVCELISSKTEIVVGKIVLKRSDIWLAHQEVCKTNDLYDVQSGKRISNAVVSYGGIKLSPNGKVILFSEYGTKGDSRRPIYFLRTYDIETQQVRTIFQGKQMHRWEWITNDQIAFSERPSSSLLGDPRWHAVDITQVRHQ